LFSQLRLRLPTGTFPSSFPNNILNVFLIYLAHFILFYLITLIILDDDGGSRDL
jgi:hypothetical protein